MGRTKLHLYRIDIKYIRDLHRVCDHVPAVSPQTGKDNRHFITNQPENPLPLGGGMNGVRYK